MKALGYDFFLCGHPQFPITYEDGFYVVSAEYECGQFGWGGRREYFPLNKLETQGDAKAFQNWLRHLEDESRARRVEMWARNYDPKKVKHFVRLNARNCWLKPSHLFGNEQED